MKSLNIVAPKAVPNKLKEYLSDDGSLLYIPKDKLDGLVFDLLDAGFAMSVLDNYAGSYISNETRYYAGILKCCQRYSYIDKEGDLQEFLHKLREGCISRLPLNKMNRWLGYVQGMLIAYGFTTVEDERNFTRPLFKHLDYN